MVATRASRGVGCTIVHSIASADAELAALGDDFW
jgi:hypothetical protein